LRWHAAFSGIELNEHPPLEAESADGLLETSLGQPSRRDASDIRIGIGVRIIEPPLVPREELLGGRLPLAERRPLSPPSRREPLAGSPLSRREPPLMGALARREPVVCTSSRPSPQPCEERRRARSVDTSTSKRGVHPELRAEAQRLETLLDTSLGQPSSRVASDMGGGGGAPPPLPPPTGTCTTLDARRAPV